LIETQLDSPVESGNNTARTWICCQLSARDHYCIPRGLHRQGRLAALITDTWIPPTSPLANLPGTFGDRLRARYDPALVDANVVDHSTFALGYETFLGLRSWPNAWDSIIARNNWFQERAISSLRTLARQAPKSTKVVFAYSYAAKKILQTARDLGYITVLGQIDPGPVEERIVADLYLRRGEKMPDWQRVPNIYWETWREECELSHRIIVNSTWTRDALIREGVPRTKICVVPLAYDPPQSALRFNRTYPKSFNSARPLRVLFLGSCIPRKGVYELLDAARLLSRAPVEFRFVGSFGSDVKSDLFAKSNVTLTGPVPRNEVHECYCHADVFIIPTHSDGFGLTQLEAMAWRLPVIASKNCGNVVKHRISGLLINEVTPEAIAESIEWCIVNPKKLSLMSTNAASIGEEFGTSKMIHRVMGCAEKNKTC
jgi:glycosyltransferase involved in cell wall biosynthesis